MSNQKLLPPVGTIFKINYGHEPKIYILEEENKLLQLQTCEHFFIHAFDRNSTEYINYFAAQAECIDDHMYETNKSFGASTLFNRINNTPVLFFFTDKPTFDEEDFYRAFEDYENNNDKVHEIIYPEDK